MCTGAEIATLALAAGGTVLNTMAADDAAEQRQRIINQAAEEDARLSKQKADTIEKFAENTFNPEKREQRYEDAATKQETSLVDTLLKANAGNNGGEVTNATQGALSGDYARARGAATAAATEDILKRARLMARSNAANLMYNDETLKGGQLASDVAGIGSQSARNNRSASLQLGNVSNNGSLVGGLLTGFSGAAGNYLGGKQAEWNAALSAMGG